jgi:hypothetical protein
MHGFDEFRGNLYHLNAEEELEWTPKMRQPVNSSNPWNGEYWDDVSEKVFQGV